jgi:GAF domain-containing protein
MSQDPLAAAVSALAQFLVADVSLGETLQRVADISQHAVPAARFVGISMLDGEGEAATAIFTDPTSPEIDQAQYQTGSGPCLDAWRQGRNVRIFDTASANDYPEFSRAAAAHGIRSTLSLPLLTAGRSLGAVNLYAGEVDGFSADDEDLLGELIVPAAAVLANAAAYWGAHELSETLRAAMATRAVIEQAKGILMARTPGVGADGAFELLVRASQRENVKLRDIAARIVAANDTGGM